MGWPVRAAEPGPDALTTVPDVLEPGLRVLFVGINPGLRSAEVGHHFARPGNRFWKALHGAGFTDRVLGPAEDGSLPAWGIGITNLVARPSGNADEITRQELRAGARRVERLVGRYRPAAVAFLGVGAYRAAFGKPRAAVGAQPERLAGAPVWVLPNPSGRTAAYQVPDLVRLFGELRAAVDSGGVGGSA